MNYFLLLFLLPLSVFASTEADFSVPIQSVVHQQSTTPAKCAYSIKKKLGRIDIQLGAGCDFYSGSSFVVKRLCQTPSNINESVRIYGELLNSAFVLSPDLCDEPRATKHYQPPAPRKKNRIVQKTLVKKHAREPEYFIQYWAGKHVPDTAFFQCVSGVMPLSVHTEKGTYYVLSKGAMTLRQAKTMQTKVSQHCSPASWLRPLSLSFK
ncbi:hypothetical protein [Photobacterium indicum]|uniref:hypothetical protein n=1 Tax=Photobacterium indicum TaxID=81447 RepID=UPI003D136F34